MSADQIASMRKHLEWYKETELPGGYRIARGGRQTGHCENYCEFIIRDENIVTFVTPVNDKWQSDTLGDVIDSLLLKRKTLQHDLDIVNEMLLHFETGDRTAELGSRYSK